MRSEAVSFVPAYQWTETVTGAADSSKPRERRYAAGLFRGEAVCAVWIQGAWRLRSPEPQFAAAELLKLAQIAGVTNG